VVNTAIWIEYEFAVGYGFHDFLTKFQRSKVPKKQRLCLNI
jgi:hypothetical protein